MDGIERADTASEPPERNTPSGYFIAIIAVLGGTLLIPPFSLVFTWIGAMLLVALIVVLLIYRTRREQKRRLGVGCRGQFTMPIADSSAWNVGTGQSCLGTGILRPPPIHRPYRIPGRS